MRCYAVAGILISITLAGCTSSPWTQPPAPYAVATANPAFIPSTDPDQVFETVVDVLDHYFRIEHEEPIRVTNNLVTEGRVDTFPQVSGTALEPWRDDSLGRYQLVESTLQTMRRRAIARIMPTQGGFFVEISVFKELENASQPAHPSAGPATFRYDSSLTRIVAPVGQQDVNIGWIPMGRDPLLEQRLLEKIQGRFGEVMASVPGHKRG